LYLLFYNDKGIVFHGAFVNGVKGEEEEEKESGTREFILATKKKTAFEMYPG
jgi:hypothetical protein